MLKTINQSKKLIVFLLILLQVSDSWCRDDLWKSVVQIYKNDRYFCAGTLVHDKYVVTTATCLERDNEFSSYAVKGNGVESSVVNVFKPEGHRFPSVEMNVAVLKLERSFAGSATTSAELCNLQSYNNGEPFSVTAWDFEDDVSTPPTVLAPYDFYFIDSETCGAMNGRPLPDSTFCGGAYEDIYTLRDRGDPATIQDQFCGIYSFGFSMIHNNSRVVFTSLLEPKVRAFVLESITS